MGDIDTKIERLKAAELTELVTLYQQLFGSKPTSGKREFLIRQLSYRVQEQAIGGLSPRTRERIQELIRLYDPINKTAIRSDSGKTNTGRDIRLPMPGSIIIKNYKGKRLEVKVLEEGFQYEGQIYTNLSHIAKTITGAHWNGFTFFGVKNNGRKW